jgi:predicted Na+-dependent transporter
MAEFHFRSMEASHIESDVTIEFLVGDLVIHFAGIFHLSFSVQKLFKNFMLVQWLKIFFQFLGANMTPKNFFANVQTPKRHFLEKICVD